MQHQDLTDRGRVMGWDLEGHSLDGMLGCRSVRYARFYKIHVFVLHMGVSKSSVTPKSSILIGFSIINHPFWDIPIFGNTHILFGWYLVMRKWAKDGHFQNRFPPCLVQIGIPTGDAIYMFPTKWRSRWSHRILPNHWLVIENHEKPIRFKDSNWKNLTTTVYNHETPEMLCPQMSNSLWLSFERNFETLKISATRAQCWVNYDATSGKGFSPRDSLVGE